MPQIPYPHREIQYPVIYNRASNNPFWKRRRFEAYAGVPKYLSLHMTLGKSKTFIDNAATYERQKEDEFLTKFYQQDDNLSHTDKFNVLFQSKDLYNEFNSRIKYILETKQFQENKTYGQPGGAKHKYYTGLAPNLSSVFMDYFMRHFEQTALPDFYKSINQKMAHDDIYMSQLEEGLYNAVYKAIELASIEMTDIKKMNDNGAGWGMEWKPVLDMLQNGDPRFRKIFTNTVREAIGPNLLSDLLNSLRGARREKRRVSKKLIQEITYNSLGNVRGQTAQKGGLIAEVVAPLITQNLHREGADLNYKVWTDRLGSNVTMTDFISLWTTNMSLDLEKFEQQMRVAMESGDETMMRQIYQKMEEFYNKNDVQKEMDELYMVFVNAKNYSVGHDANNYEKNYKGHFDELPSFLDANGIPVDRVKDFLRFAYNTGYGAINFNQRNEFNESVVNALKAVAANIMFDDYTQIGHGNTNSIHMYYLSGKYIPASVVLTAMSDALDNARSNVKASITLPDPIDDPYDPNIKPGQGWAKANDQGEIKATDINIKTAIYEHWKEEAENARVVSTWSISFTLKIKQLLANTK